MQLLLFDIDGTLLIRAAEDHAAAIRRALRQVYGVNGADEVPVATAGRTDPAIARDILLQLGVSADRIDDRMVDFKRAAVQTYARMTPRDLSENVAPGVAELLETLAAREDRIVSLVTGNLEGIAHVKLERAGLGQYFARGQGGFGSDDEDRSELPAVARARAGRRGAPFPREQTVLVGDTPLDIACARADGVRCVAVTTGAYGVDDLARADDVARSPAELARLLL